MAELVATRMVSEADWWKKQAAKLGSVKAALIKHLDEGDDQAVGSQIEDVCVALSEMVEDFEGFEEQALARFVEANSGKPKP